MLIEKKVIMKKTLAPDEVPNGTEGTLFIENGRDSGLFSAVFNGFIAYVYLDEVELVDESGMEGGE